MPATSKKQQQLMGMAYAHKTGRLKNPSQAVIDLADSMTEEDLSDFAHTKHEGLPEKKGMFGGIGDPRNSASKAMKPIPAAVGPAPTKAPTNVLAGSPGAGTAITSNARPKPSFPNRGKTMTKISAYQMGLALMMAKAAVDWRHLLELERGRQSKPKQNDKPKPKEEKKTAAHNCGSDMSKYRRKGNSKAPDRGKTMTKLSSEDKARVRKLVGMAKLTKILSVISR